MDLLSLLQFGSAGWGDELVYGALVTISLALVTLPFGIAAGFALALGRMSPDPLVRLSSAMYSNVFRGIPELLTLFLVYYGAQAAISAITVPLFGRPLDISPFVAGVVALGMVFASYAAEVFVSAFRAIPQTQYDAAAAMGLTRAQAMRLVIFPQLVRLALPGLSNLWLILIKDTSLVSVISLNDLLRVTSLAVGFTKQPFFFYGVACAIYLSISLLSSVGIWRVDAWASRGTLRETDR